MVQQKDFFILNGEKITSLSVENDFEEDTFDHCVSTIPLTKLLDACNIGSKNLPIRFRSIIFVFLEIPNEEITPFHWIYYPDPNICFQRLTNFTLLLGKYVRVIRT